MPTLTAFLHTKNDALRVGRCLETLCPCDEIIVIDHASRDDTVQIAREYGARIFPGDAIFTPRSDAWILCLDPRESLSESLAASLYEWKSESRADAQAFSVFLREETANGWIEHPIPQTRLVPSTWTRWQGRLPTAEPSALALDGGLLRFTLP